MLNPTSSPLRQRVLIVDDELAKLETALGRAAEGLALALEGRNVDVVRALSFEDGLAIVGTDASLRAVLLDWNLGQNTEGTHAQATALLHKLRERQGAIPVFLLAERERTRGTMTIEVAEMIDEFVWLLEDTADFTAGRVMAAIRRYEAQLLPPYARVLAEYARLREHSWSAPGHQGGIAFTKHPAGRAFFDFLGENVFRIDMGIERGALGSLLDHTGPIAESEKYAARVFGAHRSYSGVVGTSGSNRSIMQACMKEDDLVILDRNCHKSIEQGLMLTGARPVYMVPTRNRYGIIGPISPSEMDREDYPHEGTGGFPHEERCRPEASVRGPHQQHVRWAVLQRRAGASAARAIVRPDPLRRGVVRLRPVQPNVRTTTSQCAVIRLRTAGPRCSPHIPRTSCSRRCRRPPTSTFETARAQSTITVSTKHTCCTPQPRRFTQLSHPMISPPR